MKKTTLNQQLNQLNQHLPERIITQELGIFSATRIIDQMLSINNRTQK